MDGLLLTHAAATLSLTGLIWTVQIVHYPLFAHVGAGGFRAYHAAHARRMTAVVAPLMLVELGTAAWLVWSPPTPELRTLAGVGAALVAVNWLSTAFVQVPLHAALERGFDAAVHRRLVRTNWARTVAWTVRAGIALLLLGDLS